MSKVQIVVDEILLGVSNSSYQLVLKDVNSKMRIPIVIGAPEAQSIALALEGKQMKRPNSHDLILNFSKQIKATLTEVFINKLEEGVFHSELIFKTVDGYTFNLDSRTSDAVAIALRFDAPLFIKKTILMEAGVDIEENEYGPGRVSSEITPPRPQSFKEELELMTIEELNTVLQYALNEEDYDKAAMIRDEISKR